MPPPDRVPDRYATDELGGFDSTLPAFILAHLRSVGKSAADDADPNIALDGLPPDLHGLMDLVPAVPEESEVGKQPKSSSDIRKLGKISLKVWASVVSVAEFTGNSVLSPGRLFTGRARFRDHDFWMILQECGPQALPIVTLISFLIGLILVLYWSQTLEAIDLTTASLGVFKSFFFGAAIALSGCLQGMHAGNSSAAVGQATTRAVVASITAVIVIDSAFAAIFTVLGI